MRIKRSNLWLPVATGLCLVASHPALAKPVVTGLTGTIGPTHEAIYFDPYIGRGAHGIVHFNLSFTKPVIDFMGQITFSGYYDILTCSTPQPGPACGGALPGGGDDYYAFFGDLDGTKQHFGLNASVYTAYNFLFRDKSGYVFEQNVVTPYQAYFEGASSSGNADWTLTEYLTGVPEPATWVMMLVGFGAVGFSMRRTRAIRNRVAWGL